MNTHERDDLSVEPLSDQDAEEEDLLSNPGTLAPLCIRAKHIIFLFIPCGLINCFEFRECTEKLFCNTTFRGT